jgi:hypothetical protein
MPKLVADVAVYNGNYFDEKHRGRLAYEYSGGGVPVTVELQAGLRLRLGNIDPCPGFLVERQTDRWFFSIHIDDDFDPALLVWITDDGHVFAMPEGPRRYDDVTFITDRPWEVPASLPWETVRYKDAVFTPGEGEIYGEQPKKE